MEAFERFLAITSTSLILCRGLRVCIGGPKIDQNAKIAIFQHKFSNK